MAYRVIQVTTAGAETHETRDRENAERYMKLCRRDTATFYAVLVDTSLDRVLDEYFRIDQSHPATAPVASVAWPNPNPPMRREP